jgi:hypothetical protein
MNELIAKLPHAFSSWLLVITLAAFGVHRRPVTVRRSARSLTMRRRFPHPPAVASHVA